MQNRDNLNWFFAQNVFCLTNYLSGREITNSVKKISVRKWHFFLHYLWLFMLCYSLKVINVKQNIFLQLSSKQFELFPELFLFCCLQSQIQIKALAYLFCTVLVTFWRSHLALSVKSADLYLVRDWGRWPPVGWG